VTPVNILSQHSSTFHNAKYFKFSTKTILASPWSIWRELSFPNQLTTPSYRTNPLPNEHYMRKEYLPNIGGYCACRRVFYKALWLQPNSHSVSPGPCSGEFSTVPQPSPSRTPSAPSASIASTFGASTFQSMPMSPISTVWRGRCV